MTPSSATLHTISRQLGDMISALEDESSRMGSQLDNVTRRLRHIDENWHGPRSVDTLGATSVYVALATNAPRAIDDSTVVLGQLQRRADEIKSYMATYEAVIGDLAERRSSGEELSAADSTSEHQAHRHLDGLVGDWGRACVDFTSRLSSAIDELTSCSLQTVSGLPCQVLPSTEFGALVLWFADLTGIDVAILDVVPPEPPSEGWLKLEELYDLAYNTPGLPHSVQQSYADEYAWFQMLYGASENGGYAQEQVRGAVDAYLAGASRQYCDDLLWGVNGYTAIFGPADEDEQNIFIEANYELSRYVGIASAEGREAEMLPDYVVVEFSGGAAGIVGSGVFVISSSGRVFSGPALGAGTAGFGVNARAGYISPSGENYSGEEADSFITGVALNGSVTAPPLSGGISFPLTPFQPFEPGRSAVEVGVGTTPGADISIAWLRPTDLEYAGWSDG